MSQLAPAHPPVPSGQEPPAAVRRGVCAIIPARGGSKGVPRKNLRELGGEPLVGRAVRTLREVGGIDAVIVSTDDEEIADAGRGYGALVIERPRHLAGDSASSESALRHALDELGSYGSVPDVTVFVQATSPFITPADVDRAIALVRTGECDVAFSVARSHAHLWRDGPDGPVGVNHDTTTRARRQDREAEFVETGAFYVLRTRGFLEHGHRFFGRVRMVEVDAADALEIDTPDDLRLAELVLAHREAHRPTPLRARAVVTDFDGVHTSDRVTVDEFGVESVTVNRSDGMGVSMLRKAGIAMLILSSETNGVVAARAAKLGVDVIHGCDDKPTALRAWAAENGIALSDIAYLGNDVNDIGCLRLVGWPVAVADAHPAALHAAHIVLRRHGGDGVVRELADRVLAGTTSHESSTREGRNHG
ncbi:3-deoxy-D-manno-octulosonate 8-phosphate phosphatase, YrbI family [Aeromicrobium marinum DSM 15272]|uniref:N-acylneuraminate cytidylyltransferase n=1 Tax=Aeromicrobium marinum DSM 15272 TaxID=585531 RepID=E2SAE4_9ACTN|nr:3-deoxy-D-manno-octulosonate 8-phosphate phosphatase, YrbI family [Aeromicrobium marinum DSM 15272]